MSRRANGQLKRAMQRTCMKVRNGFAWLHPPIQSCVSFLAHCILPFTLNTLLESNRSFLRL
ncbi:hypothetical protein AALP_AA1G130700 [Arabis alpina]|uniref:Uncharacterized protein n=1 Tax=Arabis alpina TaxID=50452 RepID=A0A087HMY1_ARAAL|nr:hypothetical protein AALP_AA1G130700 [Arabis alpina]